MVGWLIALLAGLQLIHVKPPEIWLEDRRRKVLSDQVSWRMKKVLYKRRKSARYWTEVFADIMDNFALERSLSALTFADRRKSQQKIL